MSVASGFAFATSTSGKISSCPFKAAECSGVLPVVRGLVRRVGWVGTALGWKSNASVWPFFVATKMGMAPWSSALVIQVSLGQYE